MIRTACRMMSLMNVRKTRHREYHPICSGYYVVLKVICQSTSARMNTRQDLREGWGIWRKRLFAFIPLKYLRNGKQQQDQYAD